MAFRPLLLCLAAALANAAPLAAEGPRPAPTETTTRCTGTAVWDPASRRCVDPRGASLDAETLYLAARELAYAGRLAAAQAVLALFPDQTDDRVLTYWGFTHRKLGDAERAMAFYRAALARNPDNLVARSYMGQGFVEAGDIDAARAELTEIRRRGGRESWPELALERSLGAGRGYAY